MFIYVFFRLVVRFLLLFVGSAKITGSKNVPSTGPYIVIVNHMSKADPALVLLALPGVQIKYFAGEYWKRHLIFGPLLGLTGGIFVKRGVVDRKALHEAQIAIEEGYVFGLAPEGTRSKVGALIKARNGAAYMATRVNVPILPIGIVYSDLIAKNLPRLRPTKLEIRIGEPIMLPQSNVQPTRSELAAYTHYLMIHIARLLPERYWGYYAGSPAFNALLNGEDPWPHCQEAEATGSAETEISSIELDLDFH